MKKTIITIVAITCMIGFTTASSQAGSSKRDRLKGFIIGSHVGFLGATIINQIHRDKQKVYAPEPRRHKKHYRSKNQRGRYRARNQRRYRSTGHWEAKRRWVPEQYEERWNPGHYNRKGIWKSGRYQIFVVREGYWKEKQIWVAHY